MKFEEYPYKRPDLDSESRLFLQYADSIRSAQDSRTVLDAITKINELQNHFETMAVLVEIRNSINTKDAFYEQEKEFFDEAIPKMEKVSFEYYKALTESCFKQEIEKAFGIHLLEIAELRVKSFKDELIPLMIEENKLTTEYQKLYASAEILFDGETLNISGLEAKLESPDRQIRKDAFKAYAGFFRDNESKFDDIYDKLVHNRNEQGKVMGFENFTPLGYMRMGRLDYGPEEVKKYREQVVRDLVPVCSELRKKQAAGIGVEKLKCYDEKIHFLDGNAVPVGDKDYLVEQAGQMYDEMSEETSEYFRLMRENGLLDLETKPGKAMGGYCTFINDYKVPFIFSNFNHTSADVDVLTHESGHAFQSYMTSLHTEIPEFAFPTSESAEIHSMTMEYLAYPWMERFFGNQTKKYKSLHMTDALTFIPYGCCVDEFQHEVYANPEMTPAQRKEVWSRLEKKYMPERDYDGEDVFERGGFFFQKLHIFMYPFYYIDYTLASISAFELFGKSLKDREDAWKSYLKLCCLGGSKRYLELLSEAGLSVPFKDGSVKAAIQPLLNQLETMDAH